VKGIFRAEIIDVGFRDCNPGPVFSIPGFGIGGFLIPGSRRDYGIPAMVLKTVILGPYC